MHNVEIERKFLIDGFPISLPLIEEATVWQGYLSTDPVVRIRQKQTAAGNSYRLCIKGDGTLVRPEIEIPMDEDTYKALCDLLPISPIRKDFRVFKLPDGTRLECSLVDQGATTAFYYAEVEFDTVEAANAFTPPAFLTEEKTEDPSFTMSRYWELRVQQHIAK